MLGSSIYHSLTLPPCIILSPSFHVSLSRPPFLPHTLPLPLPLPLSLTPALTLLSRLQAMQIPGVTADEIQQIQLHHQQQQQQLQQLEVKQVMR